MSSPDKLFFYVNYLPKTKPEHIVIYVHTHTLSPPPIKSQKSLLSSLKKIVYAANSKMATAVSGF